MLAEKLFDFFVALAVLILALTLGEVNLGEFSLWIGGAFAEKFNLRQIIDACRGLQIVCLTRSCKREILFNVSVGACVRRQWCYRYGW